MKRHLLLGLAITLLLGAAAPQDAASKKDKDSLDAKLLAQEKLLWEAYQKKDANALGNLLADEFLEIVASGNRFTKAQILAVVADITVDEFPMEDVVVLPAGKETAIVTYKVRVKGSFKGKPFAPNASLFSTVWTQRDGKWQALLSQETRMKE